MTTIQQNLLNPNNQPLVIGNFSIRQDEDGRYCLNDLHKASGGLEKYKPTRFIRNQQTQELIREIEQVSDMRLCENNQRPKMVFAVKTFHGGANQGTYVVEDLVYSYAMWISAKFHLMVIRAYRSQVMEWMIGGKQTISPEQCGILYNIVHTRAGVNKKFIVQMWSRLKNHFKYSASYRELLAIHFQDAVDYLETMELKSGTGIVIEDNQSLRILCTHSKLFTTWWRTHSPALGKLNPQLVYMLNDNMFYMSCAIDDLCKKYAIELPAYDYQRMFLLETESDKRFRLIG